MTKVKINPDEFLEIPGLNCRIDSDKLKSKDGDNVSLDFAEAHLLIRELNKDNGIRMRLPTLKEDYHAFKKLNNRYRETLCSPEWKAEYLDGSFLMSNPEIRIANNPRRYEFLGEFTALVETSKYCKFKENENTCWLGISTDNYDRAALFSEFNGKKYSMGAVPPLSNCYGIRVVIDKDEIH